MRGKKGVSGVILTIIMIVLVLAAVVIIWGIINTFLTTQSGEIDVGTKCLGVDIQVTKLSCLGGANDVCDVTVSRTARGEAIGGVKLVFSNALGEDNYVHDVSGNIAPLEKLTVQNITTTLTDVSEAEVVVYFTDDLGNEKLC